MEIIPANTVKQFQEIERLSKIILPDFYDATIPPDHTVFYIKKFCTVQAIREQIEKGFDFFLLTFKGENAGYMSIKVANNILELSKLYILNEFRGNGLGQHALSLIEELASTLKVSKIELIVHQENHRGIQFYERKGFSIIAPAIYTFENGHTIYNHKMEKSIS